MSEEPTIADNFLATAQALGLDPRLRREALDKMREANARMDADRENRDHGPDWSEWGIDHPEEGPSCKCGYNGTPEECATDRENGSRDA